MRYTAKIPQKAITKTKQIIIKKPKHHQAHRKRQQQKQPKRSQTQ